MKRVLQEGYWRSAWKLNRQIKIAGGLSGSFEFACHLG
jgi:hypothetical protein